MQFNVATLIPIYDEEIDNRGYAKYEKVDY